MSFDIKINNLDKVMRDFSKAPSKIINTLNVIIKKSAFLVEREAKQKTPVDTGRLRASIYTSIYPLKAIVQPKTNYAIYVHEGTRYMRARPFMKWGKDNAEPQINSLADSEFKKLIDTI